MDKVYSNAYCNLATTSTTSPSTGIFLSTRSEIYEPATVSLNFSGKNGVDYKGKITVIDSDIWATNITRSPLMKRAWVFQERVLAPRILHFLKTKLFWECCTFQACENYPAGLPALSQTQLDRTFCPATRTVLLKRLQTEPLEHDVARYQVHHDLWSSIVEDYSHCSLTREDDKLVAIAGIAQRISDLQKNSEYVAGVWKEDLPGALLWYSEPRPGGRSFRPAKYRAPSWSWASFEGAVTFSPGPFCAKYYYCEVLDVRVQLKSSFALGQVETDSITLKGHMVDARWHSYYEREYKNFVVLENEEIEGFWFPDLIEELVDDEPEPGQFSCLAVDSGVTDSGSRFIIGLTLVKTGADCGQYRRIGYFTLGGPKGVEFSLGLEKQENKIYLYLWDETESCLLTLAVETLRQ